MKPLENITCAVCGGVVYDKAHFTAIEGDLLVYLGSNECAEALARCMRTTGLSLEDAIKIPK